MIKLFGLTYNAIPSGTLRNWRLWIADDKNSRIKSITSNCDSTTLEIIQRLVVNLDCCEFHEIIDLNDGAFARLMKIEGYEINE